MDALKSSLLTVGQVFGLVLGNGFTSPPNETIERYWYLQLPY